MSNCLAVNTENGLEKTAQANNVATAIKLALLQEQAMQGLGFNTREYITVSGEWEASVTGTYKITIIDGGDGVNYNSTLADGARAMFGGKSGNFGEYYVQLTKGQKVDVTIGAGGIAGSGTVFFGGKTFFGELGSVDGTYLNPSVDWHHAAGVDAKSVFVYGGGFGGGQANTVYQNGQWYGAGGGGYIHYDNSTLAVGNGYQGCVIAEYFDSSKVPLPVIDGEVLVPYISLIERIEALEAAISE